MYFKDILGHKGIIENLINLIDNKKAGHAYIFSGPKGIGKMKTASAFAAGLLCENFREDTCGECKSCHLTFGNAHPDLKIVDYSIDSDGKQKASISVDAIREFKTDVYLKPFYSERKIYILDNADKLTVEAQNALLKIFEEPPAYTTVILICNNLSKMLSTIISRAVLVKFSSLKPEELEIYLNKYYNNTDNKKIYSRIANGSISEMIKNIEDENSLEFRNSVITGIIAFFTSPVNSSFNQLLKIFMKNKEKKYEIIDMISVFVMDCLFFKTGLTDRMVNSDKIEDVKKITRELSVKEIGNIENILITLNKNLNANGNYKLTVINSLLKIQEEIYG